MTLLLLNQSLNGFNVVYRKLNESLLQVFIIAKNNFSSRTFLNFQLVSD